MFKDRGLIKRMRMYFAARHSALQDADIKGKDLVCRCHSFMQQYSPHKLARMKNAQRVLEEYSFMRCFRQYMCNTLITCKRVSNLLSFMLDHPHLPYYTVLHVMADLSDAPDITKMVCGRCISANQVISNAAGGKVYVAYACSKKFKRRYRYGPH